MSVPESPQKSADVSAFRSVSELRAHFREGKAALVEQFRASRPTGSAVTRLTRALTRHVDATLEGLWVHTAMLQGATLMAVGGYGRGELFPYSDVDVVVLLPAGHESDATRAGVEGFIAACWDIGLEIGSSVRTVEECLAESQRDVTVQTALLESRFLAGSRRLFQQFRRANMDAMDPRAFLRAKTLEMHQRHVKYEDTPYSLEPNCKESPGGLRDLQVVIWVARAARLGRTWGELANKGLITPFEVKQLQRNEAVIKAIRARLHMVAGRREDRLVFDLQTAVAESFGYTSHNGQRASEVLMRRYYWAAKAVTQLNQLLMLNIEERIEGSGDTPMRPINERFFDRGGLIEVASDDLYVREPRAILETFLLYQQVPGINGLSARTLRALYNARNVMDNEFRRDPVNRETFFAILRQPGGQTHAFRLMNQTSVLGRYLWVFRRIVGQMQHDLFHVYTVDQHILMVLRNVRRFFIPEHAHEYPFCSQLAAQFERPWVLFVAALFHDVAKGRGGDHSELGAVEVRRFCREHHIGREDAQLIEFLVLQHLTMSRTAQKEDLSDPEVVERFAKLVGDQRTLTALYLLTVADIRGTSPKVWNAWKGKLLEDLYRVTLRALGGAKPSLDTEIEARKQEARQQLALLTMPQGIEAPLWETLDFSYFARHEATDIAWHARMLWRHLTTEQPVVCARPSPVGEGLQVLVYARDCHDLFARICGYFDGAGFNILEAKVHTTKPVAGPSPGRLASPRGAGAEGDVGAKEGGYALDTFQVTSSYGDAQAGHYRDLISLVETQLAKAVSAEDPLPQPSRGRVSRRVKSFPVVPRVLLRPDDRAQCWLLSVSSSDRSGLLYAIARVLAAHRINLQLAKISTLGERVEDTFLVDGAALQEPRTQMAIETQLLDVLSAPA